MSTESPFNTPQPVPPAAKGSGTGKILLIIFAVLMAMMVVCGGVLVALLMPAISAARQAARTVNTQNQMKQIGLALHNYHAAYKTLPAAYSVNEAGDPQSSWRTAVVFFLDEFELGEAYAQSRSWQDAANQQFLVPSPSAFASSLDEIAQQGETHVFAIRAPGSVFEDGNPKRFADVLDGLSGTVCGAYLPDRSVPWTKPEDATPDEVFASISNSTHEAPVFLLMLDGAVMRADPQMNRSTFDAMVTCNAGDTASN